MTSAQMMPRVASHAHEVLRLMVDADWTRVNPEISNLGTNAVERIHLGWGATVANRSASYSHRLLRTVLDVRIEA